MKIFLAVTSICFLCISTLAVEKNGFDLSNSALPVDEIKRGGPPKDGIVALTSPKFESVNKTRLSDKARVLGVVVGENALFRVMDEELSDLIDTALVGQVENDQSRFRFTEPEIQASEGAEQPVIMIERIGNLTDPATATLTYVDIKTTEGEDYHSPITVEWEAGEGGAKAVELEVVDDDVREGDETMVIILVQKG